MNRNIRIASVSIATLLALGACTKKETAYDTTKAMATPPAPSPSTTTTKTESTTTTAVGAVIGGSTGARADTMIGAQSTTKTTTTKTTKKGAKKGY